MDKPKPTASEVEGEVLLEHFDYSNITISNGHVGRYDAFFYKQENPTWPDPRTIHQTLDGETCYQDDWSCSYPYCHNENEVWNRLGLAAGDLTFTIQGAPGPVVLTTFNAGITGQPDDWMYSLSETQPGPLKDGTTVHSDWFDPKYVPSAATFTLALAGGNDFNPETFTGLTMAKDFELTSPKVGETTSTTNDLTITWSPPQPGSTMLIWINWNMYCLTRDDGSITIPASVVSTVVGEVQALTMYRDMTRYAKTTTKDGKTAHIYIIGRRGKQIDIVQY